MTEAETKEIERKRNWSQTKAKATLYFLINCQISKSVASFKKVRKLCQQ